jgi:hypothetical protein
MFLPGSDVRDAGCGDSMNRKFSDHGTRITDPDCAFIK